MFHAEIINDAGKLNEEVSKYKNIPEATNVSRQRVIDNYSQVKIQIKKLIADEVQRLKSEKGLT